MLVANSLFLKLYVVLSLKLVVSISPMVNSSSTKDFVVFKILNL
jgi:hypothetical protein